MIKNNVTIEFYSKHIVESKINQIVPIVIHISGHSYEQICFKVSSPAFGGKIYFVKKPAYAKEHVLNALFLCPGKNQDIKLTPLENCTTGTKDTIKANISGAPKDIRGLPITIAPHPTTYCNINRLSIDSKKTNLTIEKTPNERSAFLVLNSLNDNKEMYQKKLMNSIGAYNAALHFWENNDVSFKAADLYDKLKCSEKEMLIAQKKLENSFANAEFLARQKINTIHLKENSVLKFTSVTSDNTSENINGRKLNMTIENGNKSCHQHPRLVIAEYKEMALGSPLETSSFKKKEISLDLHQCYSESDYKVHFEGGITPNERIEKAKETFSFWREKLEPQKKYKVYRLSVKSCGLPDIITSIDEKPVKSLSADIHVYPSDEYTYFMGSKASLHMSISNKEKMKIPLKIPFISYLSRERPENYDYQPDNTNRINFSLSPRLNDLLEDYKEKPQLDIKEKFNDPLEFYNNNEADLEKFLKRTELKYFRNGNNIKQLNTNRPFWKSIYSLIQRIKTSYLNVTNVSYLRSFDAFLDIRILAGYYCQKWGIKEYFDNTVFEWRRVESDLDVFRNSIRMMFDSFWGIGGELYKGKNFFSSKGNLKHKQSYEKTTLNDYYKYCRFLGDQKILPFLQMYIENDSSTNLGNIVNSGLNAETEASFNIQFEDKTDFQYKIFFNGLKIEVESKIPVFKTHYYEKELIEPYPGGNLIKKSTIPNIPLLPWTEIQSKYEILYGKISRLKNLLKEAIANLYHLQYQTLSCRSYEENLSEGKLKEWKKDILKPELDIDGMPVFNKEADQENYLSEYTSQWGKYFDGIDIERISGTSQKIGKIYKGLKNVNEEFLLRDYEDRSTGTDVLNSTLLAACTGDFLETELRRFTNIQTLLKEEINYLIMLENDYETSNSAELNEETKNNLLKKYEDFIEKHEIEDINKGLDGVDLNEINTLSSKVNLKIDFRNIEEICKKITDIKDNLYDNLKKRKLWCKESPNMLTLIFEPE